MRVRALAYVRAVDRRGVDEPRQRILEWAAKHGTAVVGVYYDTEIQFRSGEKYTSLDGITSLLDRLDEIEVDHVLVLDMADLSSTAWTLDVRRELEAREMPLVLAQRGARRAPASAPVARIPVPRLPKPAPEVSEERPPEPLAAPEPAVPTDRSQYMLAGRKRSVGDGYKGSGPVPYGYMRGPSDGSGRSTIVPSPVEMELVREIFRRYLVVRVSLAKLVGALNAEGKRTRRGSLWSRAGVSWILRNPLYVGRVRFGPVEARGRHVPIVPQIVFNRVRAKLREQRRGPTAFVEPEPIEGPLAVRTG